MWLDKQHMADLRDGHTPRSADGSSVAGDKGGAGAAIMRTPSSMWKWLKAKGSRQQLVRQEEDTVFTQGGAWDSFHNKRGAEPVNTRKPRSARKGTNSKKVAVSSAKSSSSKRGRGKGYSHVKKHSSATTRSTNSSGSDSSSSSGDDSSDDDMPRVTPRRSRSPRTARSSRHSSVKSRTRSTGKRSMGKGQRGRSDSSGSHSRRGAGTPANFSAASSIEGTWADVM